jgi:hypothetical protein
MTSDKTQRDAINNERFSAKIGQQDSRDFDLCFAYSSD